MHIISSPTAGRIYRICRKANISISRSENIDGNPSAPSGHLPLHKGGLECSTARTILFKEEHMEENTNMEVQESAASPVEESFEELIRGKYKSEFDAQPCQSRSLSFVYG